MAFFWLWAIGRLVANGRGSHSAMRCPRILLLLALAESIGYVWHRYHEEVIRV